jgi:hypothetical protein
MPPLLKKIPEFLANAGIFFLFISFPCLCDLDKAAVYFRLSPYVSLDMPIGRLDIFHPTSYTSFPYTAHSKKDKFFLLP